MSALIKVAMAIKNHCTPHKRMARKLRRLSDYAGNHGFMVAATQYARDAQKIEDSE